jgi:sugar lactone lactonase YvrE
MSRSWHISASLALLLLGGCIGAGPSSGHLEKAWGDHGYGPGKVHKPRAIAIDRDDHLYLVDMTARIQVFDRDGNYLRGWSTPESKNGRPTGLSFDNDGNLLVADTHYFRMLVYTPEGKLLTKRTIGGTCGFEPGQFNFVTDAVQDSKGNYYISEYGEYDRIQKFSPDGKFLTQWGGHGSEPGQFSRPQSLAIDQEDRLWVADACNHRIQVFDVSGEKPRLVRMWGQHGHALGQLRYPYGLLLDGRGHVYVCEFGNHRVQKLTLDGKPLGAWGESGRQEGCLFNPWAIAQDSRGRIHVVDTYNHRVQRIAL